MNANADDNVNPPVRLTRWHQVVIGLVGLVGVAQAGATFANAGLVSLIGLVVLAIVMFVVLCFVALFITLNFILIKHQTEEFLSWFLAGVAVICAGWLWLPLQPCFIGNQYHADSILIAPPWTRVVDAHSLPKELRLIEREVVVREQRLVGKDVFVREHSVDITVVVPLAPDENNHVAIYQLAEAGRENRPYVEERMNSVGGAGARLLTRVVQAVHSNAGFSLGKYGSVVGVDRNALSDRLKPTLSALPLKLGDGPIEVWVEPSPSGTLKAENNVLFVPLGQLL